MDEPAPPQAPHVDGAAPSPPPPVGARMGRALLALGLLGLAAGAAASWSFWEPVPEAADAYEPPRFSAGGSVPTSQTGGGDPGTPRALPSPDAPFDGPSDAATILASCVPEPSRYDCYIDRLEALLAARGSEVAYAVLAEMAAMDRTVDMQSHPLAHVLGAYALTVYGTIQATLENCSYKVFQGCFHGAFQAYLTDQPDITPELVRDMCKVENPFRLYVCLHGMGHGLMLATENGVNQSLELCDALETDYARGSCYGGVLMENLVGYIDSTQAAAIGGHLHGSDAPYMVDPDDPYFPCDAVLEKYRNSCWLLQTSLILFFNHGDFADAAQKCAALPPPHYTTCFGSLGRDASAYAGRDPKQVQQSCGYAPTDGRAPCIRGFIAEVILNYADPEVGLRVCRELSTTVKTPCYQEVGSQGWGMVGQDRIAEVCAKAEAGYENTCRTSALLPAR